MGPRTKRIWDNWNKPRNEWPPMCYVFSNSNKHKMRKIVSLKSAKLPYKVLVAQQGGELGIDNVKLIVTVLVTFFVDLVNIIKNKEYINLITLLFNIIKQGNIIASAKQAWEEIKDASLQETNDIHLHFTEVLDLDDDRAEQLIERAFGIIPKVYELALRVVGFISDGRALLDEVKSIFGGEELDIETPDTTLLLAA